MVSNISCEGLSETFVGWEVYPTWFFVFGLLFLLKLGPTNKNEKE